MAYLHASAIRLQSNSGWSIIIILIFDEIAMLQWLFAPNSKEQQQELGSNWATRNKEEE